MSNTDTAPAQDKRILTIDERILAIEAELPFKSMPGTTLSRVFKETQGVEWCLALGAIQMPKTFFKGPTIEDVVAQGEKAVAEMKANGMNRLPTDWDLLTETLTVREPKDSGRGFAAFDDAVGTGSAKVKPAKGPSKKKGA